MSTKKYKRVVVWFRCDLRVTDNSALCEACEQSDEVIPLFVLDDSILTRDDTGAARVVFLLDALKHLDASLKQLGSQLTIKRGTAGELVSQAAVEWNADAVFVNREYEPHLITRDEAVSARLRGLGIEWNSHSGRVLHEPGDIRTQAGGFYTVFTPYKRVWFDVAAESPRPAPTRVNTPPRVIVSPVPAAASLGISTAQKFECGGELAAVRLLNEFVPSKLARYEVDRDIPAIAGTSLLSRHLHFGTISPRTLLAQVKSRPGAEPFLNEIAWREFYVQVLYNNPHVAKRAFRPEYDNIDWLGDERHFTAWTQGLTGYPIVDAAMRQLREEAWMHNRCRMIVASFLTKDLLLDWHLGERHFMKMLVDGDIASNNGGWQWSAGTGTDAQPYFRVFNPVSQGEKFDPQGDYVRRYVPELKRVPDKFIHKPWMLSGPEQEYVGCRIGRDYPAPIVDHAVQRDVAVNMYRRAVASSREPRG